MKQLAVLIHCYEELLTGDSGLRATGKLVTWEHGKIRNLPDGRDFDWEDKTDENSLYAIRQARGLSNLLIDAWSSPKYPNEYIGWSFAIRQPYSLDMRELHWVYRSMKRLDSAVEKMAERFGRATTFAEWFTRVGDALKVSVYLSCVEYVGSSYDDNEYRAMDASGARHHIDDELHKFHAKLAETAA